MHRTSCILACCSSAGRAVEGERTVREDEVGKKIAEKAAICHNQRRQLVVRPVF